MSTESNKAIVRRYREIYAANDLDRLGEVLAPDVAAHNLLPNFPKTLEGIKAVHRSTLAVFPDLHTETEDLIAEGDLVVERWTQKQTHTGAPFFVGNIPASGRKINTTGISIYRIAGGKIVEHWANMDFLGVLQQVGAVPAPGL